ncbi:MAG: archaeosortase/exosortase family protein [Bacteroidetes bacterium]|nr:archaeosortase/exosortase family protein [Bacteroidota bacterium]
MKKYFSQIPPEVRTFLIRSVLLFIGWKALYILVLIPNQVPDAGLVRKLGSGTAVVLNGIYGTDEFHAVHTERPRVYGMDTVLATYTMVKKSSRNILGIYQACNGLELMILYAGFIICFSGVWWRKTIYIVSGIIALYIANVMRCAALGWIGIEYPKHFDFAHKYFFNLIIYSIAFLWWVFYVKGLNKKDVEPAAS